MTKKPEQQISEQTLLERISKFFRENVLGILLIAIVASVIAAYLYDNRHKIWDEIKSILPWIGLLCLIGGAWWRSNSVLKSRLEAEKAGLAAELSKAQEELERKDLALYNLSDALAFDTILLILLSKFVSVPLNERMNKLKEILQELLENAVLANVGQKSVFRASIFLPTERVLNRLLADALSDNGNARITQSASISLPATSGENLEEDDYIRVWAYIGLATESVKVAECYIGEKTDVQRGLAGLAFKDSVLLVGHMAEQDGRLICNEYPDVYKRFEKHSILRYKALAVAPIVTLGRDPSKRKTVGAVCFDSMTETLFDGEEAKKALRTVSTRIGAILSIYWQLSQNEQTQQSGQAQS